MRAFIAALAAFPALALATITITDPNSSQFYWVQNTSKTITWTYASGDPNPISIVLVNSNSTYLNGPFSIYEYLDLTLKTYTITNVTLDAGTGFQVEFVNPSNHSDVYATSNVFTVMPSGSAPPPSNTLTGGPSGSASSASASRTGTGTGTATGSASSTSKNGAVKLDSMMYTLAACCLAALCSLML